ncbi:hypothetical protein ACQP2F_36205 [Actinoplanes sp. CA-030573]|uniref:hypothetical protein n=1 Tax=Actinoplanes sp. CA-030573 TaxID=3239898 RepID=UPI003D916412
MSRSPKYSFAQLGKELRDQVQHDRDSRQARREASETRIRERVLAEGRTEIVERYRTLKATLATLGRGSQQGGADAVAAALENALRTIRAASSFTELATVAGDLDRAEHSVRSLRLRAAADRTAVLAAMMAEADAELVRYDDGDAAALLAGLAALRRSDPGAAEVDRLAARILEHLDRVAARRTEHQEQRRRAAARIELLAERLDGLLADGRTMRVPVRDGDRAGEALAMLRAQFARGELADVLRFGAALERRIDEIESGLDTVIDQIAERRTVLTSLVRALPEVGFAVEAGSVTESRDGAIGLRASRPGGDTVAVIVEAETEADTSHRILYASEAVQREERLGHGDTACGNLLEVIDVLHESADRAGVVLSPVTWEGRDARRGPARNAPRRMTPPAAGTVRQEENRSWRP